MCLTKSLGTVRVRVRLRLRLRRRLKVELGLGFGLGLVPLCVGQSPFCLVRVGARPRVKVGARVRGFG